VDMESLSNDPARVEPECPVDYDKGTQARDTFVSENDRSKFYWIGGILTVVIVIGLALGLSLSRTKDDSSPSPTFPPGPPVTTLSPTLRETTSPPTLPVTTLLPTMPEEVNIDRDLCIAESTALMQTGDIPETIVALFEHVTLSCVPDDLDVSCEGNVVKPYPDSALPCRVSDPDLDDFEGFAKACANVGGSPFALSQTDPPLLTCTGRLGNWLDFPLKVHGFTIDYFPLCAATAESCEGASNDDIVSVSRQIAIVLLQEWGDIECSEDPIPASVLEQIDACQEKYEAYRHSICRVTTTDAGGGECSFYMCTQGQSCGEYCEQRGGTCLYAAGFDDCQPIEEKRVSCEEPFGDDICTCTL